MRVEDLDEIHHHVPPTYNRTTPWDPTKRAAATAEHARKYAAVNAFRPTTDETRKPPTQIASPHHAPAQK